MDLFSFINKDYQHSSETQLVFFVEHNLELCALQHPSKVTFMKDYLKNMEFISPTFSNSLFEAGVSQDWSKPAMAI